MADADDIIFELLKNTPFSELSMADQIQIVRKGRPQPALLDLKCEHKEKSRTYTRSFHDGNYKKYPWMTGSVKSQKLYCWPCVLLSTDSSPWNTTGFNSLNYFVSACEKHQRSVSHLRAFSSLQTFDSKLDEHVLELEKKMADCKHNEKVRENRNVLKRIIDVACFLGKQECVDDFEASRNKKMYRELIELLAKYDPVLDNHLKTAKVFKGTATEIQSDLIDAIAGEILDKIRSEVSAATFAAISLYETTDVTNKSQLARIVRFVDNSGNCHERFLGFADVSQDRTAEGLMNHVVKMVDDLKCSEKLIAHTFNGSTVATCHVSELQSLVKKKYPSATFIPSCSHSLSLVLSKSTNSIAECRRFFNSLTGISSFFSRSTARTDALEKFVERKYPGVAPTQWNFSSRLTATVGEYRDYLVKFFLSMEDDFDNWTGEEVNAASGYFHFLCKLETKFLLVIFKEIFAVSDVLFGILLNKCMDISYCAGKVNEFHNTLQKMKNDDFYRMWEEANEDEDSEPKPKMPKIEDCISSRYHRLFHDILDTLMSSIELRFGSQKEVTFVSLLDTSHFPQFRKDFPLNLFSGLKEPYASKFNVPRLKNELTVIYTSDDEYNMKTLNEFAHYMKLNHLDVVFSEVYKLTELILTFPSTIASVGKNVSALKRIKAYLKATQKQIRLSNLAVLSIEKDVLEEMIKKSEENFYDNVTLKFTVKEKRAEFMYK